MIRTAIKSFALAALAAGLVLPSLAQTPPATSAPAAPPRGAMTAEQKQSVLDAMSRVISNQAFVPGVDFSKWSEKLEARKADLEKANTEVQFVGLVNQALQSFGFSHIVLFPPAAAQARVTQRRAGIGIRIQPEDNGIRVVFVFPESPASKAGIQPGDLVVEADGKPVRQPGDLSGEEGQTSEIKIIRAGKEMKLSIKREQYSTVIPESISWQGDAAVVTIPTFDMGYNAANVDKLMGEAMKAKMVILDLRMNGGGRVTNLQHLMGWFLKSDAEPMGTFIGRMQVRQYTEANPGAPMELAKIAEATKSKVRPFRRDTQFQGKLAVLISGGTGSASEMAAAALKEYRGATLIGSKTAGAVLASLIMPLQNTNGFAMQFPVTDYMTIQGRRLEGNGLEPDHVAAIPAFGQKDEAVAKALELIKG